MLESMTEEGLIKKKADGRYELTPQGKEEIDWPSRMHGHEPKSVEEVIKHISSYISYLEDLNVTNKPEVNAQAEKLRELSTRLSKAAGE